MLAFALMFVVFCPLGILYGDKYAGEFGNIIGAAFAVCFSVIFYLLLRLFDKERIGGPSDSIFHGKRPLGRLREKQAADIDRARVLKANSRINRATRIINNVLREDPNCPEALFLKAQITWEIYKNSYSAKNYLHQVLKSTSKTIELNEEALNFYKELEEQKNSGSENSHSLNPEIQPR